LSVTAIIIEKGLLSDIIYFLEWIRGVYLSIYKFMRLRFSKLWASFTLFSWLYLFSKYTIVLVNIYGVECIDRLNMLIFKLLQFNFII
jgi:hypothetical protein